MAAPTIPSSSNNWPRGWICRVSSSQNWAFMLDTPESVKAVTSCPSIITGASLECPTRCAMGSGLRNGIGATCCHPPSLLPSYGSVWDQGQGGNVAIYWLWVVAGWTTFPWFPSSLFNGFARVAHSLAIWPQPWHLKHCRVLESFTFWVLPWAPVGAWVLPLLWEAVATLLAAEELWAEVFWPRPVWPLWELGWAGVFLSICPLPWPLCLWLFGALVGWVSCSVLFRVPSSLAIWLPSSFEPSVTSVAADDHALIFSLASSILLSAFLAATMSWE